MADDNNQESEFTFDTEKKMGEILLDKNHINEDDLETLINESSKSNKYFGEIAIERGFCSAEDILEALGEQFPEMQTLYPLLDDIEIDDIDYQGSGEESGLVTPDNIPNFENHDVLPLADGRVVLVNPLDEEAVQFALKKCSDPTFCLTTDRELRTAFVMLREAMNIDENYRSNEYDPDDETAQFTEETIDRIFQQAVRKDWSDIHFIPTRNGMEIKARQEGTLVTVESLRSSQSMYIIPRLKNIADVTVEERNMPQDGRATHTTDDGFTINLRLNFYPVRINGRPQQTCTVRVLSEAEEALTLEEIGFTDHEHKKLKRLLQAPHGIILIGSGVAEGKSTTIFACIRDILEEADGRKIVITAEDPIEYELSGAKQSQINEEYGFEDALEAAMRQDYDLMMVGEIRNKETAVQSVRGALAGKLLFSTIHANDAVATLHRIMEFDVKPSSLAEVMRGLICQRLLRHVCDECGKTIPLNKDDKKKRAIRQMFKRVGITPPDQIKSADDEGCQNCNYTGYSGRSAVTEIVTVDHEIESAIVDEDVISVRDHLKEKENFTPIEVNGMRKVAQGLTDFNELRDVFGALDDDYIDELSAFVNNDNDNEGGEDA